MSTVQSTTKRSRINTRARLLAAALDLFCEQGFQATTVENICVRAGFTRGAFYSNFTSTEELFLELWDQQAERTIEGARALVELTKTIPDPFALAEVAMVNLEIIEPRWFILNTEFFLHALRNPEVSIELSRHRKRLRHELGVVLDTFLITEGRALPPNVDLDMFARLIIATHEGSQHQSLVTGHELEPGQLQRTMMNVIFNACPPLTD